MSWDNYFNTVLSKAGGNSGGAGGSGGISGSASGGAQGQRPSKRPFTTVTSPNGTPVQSAARQAFDPFVSIPSQCLVDRDDGNRKWFIWGQNRVEMDSFMKAGKCVLCKQSEHLLAACPTRQAMFAAKKFCFHPTKK
jgi:hypothetical protein